VEENMKTPGEVTILSERDKVVFTVTDEVSRTRLVEFSMTPEQFCAAIGRLACLPVELHIGRLDRIGKKHEHATHEFEIPTAGYYHRADATKTIGKKTCPEGWVVSDNFNSQNTYFTRDGKSMARCTIRRWV
jgi:hypothetical protein